MKAAAIVGAVKNFNPISKGLETVGVTSKLFSNIDEALDWGCDFFIQTNIFNYFKESNQIYKLIEQSGKPTLVVESPVFRFINDDNHKWYRLSWNSYLFPTAKYPIQDDNDRWEKIKKEYNLRIADWQTTGTSIVIALQKFSDSSLNSLYDETIKKPFPKYVQWLDSVINQVKLTGHNKIILRPHPLNNLSQNKKLSEKYAGYTISRSNDLIHDYKCVLTFNSLYAIDCLYNGIPVISLSDSSLQNQFAKYQLIDIANPPMPSNREEIFSKLSYCQWREDEVKSGSPFTTLLECMP